MPNTEDFAARQLVRASTERKKRSANDLSNDQSTNSQKRLRLGLETENKESREATVNPSSSLSHPYVLASSHEEVLIRNQINNCYRQQRNAYRDQRDVMQINLNEMKQRYDETKNVVKGLETKLTNFEKEIDNSKRKLKRSESNRTDADSEVQAVHETLRAQQSQHEGDMDAIQSEKTSALAKLEFVQERLPEYKADNHNQEYEISFLKHQLEATRLHNRELVEKFKSIKLVVDQVSQGSLNDNKKYSSSRESSPTLVHEPDSNEQLEEQNETSLEQDIAYDELCKEDDRKASEQDHRNGSVSSRLQELASDDEKNEACRKDLLLSSHVAEEKGDPDNDRNVPSGLRWTASVWAGRSISEESDVKGNSVEDSSEDEGLFVSDDEATLKSPV